ncbi:MAG: GntR family transcriptional regulator [Candidatus Tectomicrobia bacterium]|nr:GntR family transcriptional regulator [Candidatus Tectomicrobia bacterium]
MARRAASSQPQTLQAYSALKERIITLRYRPGERLDEAQLCRELGFGRTPVREAMIRLQAEHLLVIEPKRAVTVTNLSLQEVRDFFECYHELERFNARLAAQRASAEEIAALRAIQEQIRLAVAARDHLAMTQQNTGLHRAIARASRNSYLQRMLFSLYNDSQRLAYISFSHNDLLTAAYGPILELVLEQHERIIAAIAGHDADAAEQELGAHARTFQERILRYLSHDLRADVSLTTDAA